MAVLQNLVAKSERYIWQGTDLVLMSQVKLIDSNDNYQFALQSDFIGGSINYVITVDGVAGSPVALVPGVVILDVPSTGNAWPYGSPGFNFRASLDGVNFPDSNKTYQVDVGFETGSGVEFKGQWIVKTKGNNA